MKASLLGSRAIDRLARSASRIGAPVKTRGRMPIGPDHVSTQTLVDHHFSNWSAPGHINRKSLAATLSMLEEKPALILETGSSAWGTNSSRLFDAYVANFGGEFWSVDIRLEPLITLRRVLSVRSRLICDDSVRFLHRWVHDHGVPDLRLLVYLDSWDLDIDDPIPAALHGLREFFALEPVLSSGALLLIDDTPIDPTFLPEPQQQERAHRYQREHGLVPGKGMLIDTYLARCPGVRKIHHGYQVLYEFS